MPLALRPVLERAGVIDVPNARSSHDTPVIRGGGLAQACAMVLALAYAAAVVSGQDQAILFVVLATCFIAAMLGWLEDLRGLPILLRAGAQFLIGLAATTVAAIATDHPIWWAILGGVAMIGLTNVANFMDGINTISSFHGIVAGSAYLTIGLLHHVDWLVVGGAVLAAAYAAFLPWNFNGRMFLGDVGSYLLGGAVAIVITVGWMQGLPIIALAAPMVIYVADAGFTLLSRIRAGEQWHQAHRDHTYQRLNRSGIGHIKVASIVAALSLACAVFGIGASQTSGMIRLEFLFGIAILILAYTVARFTVGSPDTVTANDKSPS